MIQETLKSLELQNIYGQLNQLVEEAECLGKGEVCAADMERHLLKSLLKMGKDLLNYSFGVRHEELEKQDVRAVFPEAVNKGLSSCSYGSIFGDIDVLYRKYHLPDKGSYSAMAASLGLPPGKYSYVLQDWLGQNSTELDYRESVGMLNEILGLNLNATQSKSQSNLLGGQVAAYYEQKAAPAVAQGNYLCVEWDGKGVSLTKPVNKGDATQMTSRSSVVGRLKRGEKRGVKKMATVSVVSDFAPRVRTKDSIIRGLFKSPLTILEQQEKQKSQGLEIVHKKSDKWHENIHRRAFMCGQQKSIDYGVQLAKDRMQSSYSKDIGIVALVDGGVGLEDNILAAFERENMSHHLEHIILDIVHVSEYVWKAGNAILGEKSSLRTSWVKQILTDLLDGKVSEVIEELQRNHDKTNLSDSAKKLLQKTITYFTNHQHKMDYKTYLEKGLPVSTALVESSCGHLVKDRMERSGMRWSLQGAQNMIDLRAVKKNGDWANFMEFICRKNHAEQKKKAA